MLKPIVVGLLLIHAVNQAIPTDYSVDLSSIQVSSDEEYLAVPEAERVGIPLAPPIDVHSPPPTAPFELAGFSVDRSDYTVGGAFQYELILRYAGSTDFTFPISSQVHLFRRSMSGLRMAVIGIRFEDQVLGNQTVDLKILYGAPLVAGSTITLSHDQTVRIRADGKWRVRDVIPSLPTPWSRQVHPVATLNMDFTPQYYSQARSAPGSVIQLTKPQ